MIAALLGLGIVSLLEVLLWTALFWRWRKVIATVFIVPLAVTSGWLVGERPAVWTVAIAFFSMYRVINLLRVVEHRPQADYLFAVGRRSSWLLMSIQVALLGLAAWQYHADFDLSVWLYLLIV